MALVDSTVCSGPCGLERPVSDFAMYAKGAGQPKKYRRTRCNECRAKDFRELATTEARKRQQRDAWLRRKYGITLEQYEAMLAKQNGVCAICDTGPRQDRVHLGNRVLHVDHCHETGMVRGLLCDSCNQGIGRFQHDTDLLLAAAGYLHGSC